MKYFFSSQHNYLDPSNGASITTRDELLELTRRGGDVRTFCGSFFGRTLFGARKMIAYLRAR